MSGCVHASCPINVCSGLLLLMLSCDELVCSHVGAYGLASNLQLCEHVRS